MDRAGRRGRPRTRPDAVYADRGYDHDKYRRQVRDKGITPVIARRGAEHGAGLGVHRWVVEQSLALLHSLVPAAADPLGGPRRHPRGLPQPGVRHHLLERAGQRLTFEEFSDVVSLLAASGRRVGASSAPADAAAPPPAAHRATRVPGWRPAVSRHDWRRRGPGTDTPGRRGTPRGRRPRSICRRACSLAWHRRC